MNRNEPQPILQAKEGRDGVFRVERPNYTLRQALLVAGVAVASFGVIKGGPAAIDAITPDQKPQKPEIEATTKVKSAEGFGTWFVAKDKLTVRLGRVPTNGEIVAYQESLEAASPHLRDGMANKGDTIHWPKPSQDLDD